MLAGRAVSLQSGRLPLQGDPGPVWEERAPSGPGLALSARREGCPGGRCGLACLFLELTFSGRAGFSAPWGGRPRAGLWDPPTTGFLLRFLIVGEKQQSQWLLPGPGSGRRRPRDPLPLPRDVLSGARGSCTPRRGEVRAGGAGRSRPGPGFGQRGDPQGNPRPRYTETRAFGAKQALGESRHIPRLSFPIQQMGP